MPVKKLNKNEIRKDGRAYVFRVSEYGLDGKRHQYKSPERNHNPSLKGWREPEV